MGGYESCAFRPKSLAPDYGFGEVFHWLVIDFELPLTSDANYNIIKRMRTTLDLEKPVLDGLKSLQKKEKVSIGKIASRLLAEALAREASLPTPQPALRWTSAPMQAKVNLADKEAVFRVLDER